MLALVGIAQIVNDGAGRAHGQGQRNRAVFLQPVGFQREDAVMPQQGAPRHLGLEGGGVHRSQRNVGITAGVNAQIRRRIPGGNQRFRGFQPRQFHRQPGSRQLGDRKLAGGNIHIGQPDLGIRPLRFIARLNA